jgi:hypothetical protein
MTSLELTSSGTASFDKGDVYFIGNATTLIRFGGLTILTDPAFLHKGEHVHLGHGVWARREVEPACQIADLPPIDLIVCRTTTAIISTMSPPESSTRNYPSSPRLTRWTSSAL